MWYALELLSIIIYDLAIANPDTGGSGVALGLAVSNGIKLLPRVSHCVTAQLKWGVASNHVSAVAQSGAVLHAPVRTLRCIRQPRARQQTRSTTHSTIVICPVPPNLPTTMYELARNRTKKRFVGLGSGPDWGIRETHPGIPPAAS
jgi:hypothetical protein